MIPLAVGIVYNLLDIFWVKSIPDIVEICLITLHSLRILLRKEPSHAFYLDHFGIKGFNSYFIIGRNIDILHLVHLK